MKRTICIAVAAIAALSLVAAGGDVLTGEDLVPGTVNGPELGASVTYVKGASVIVQPAPAPAADDPCLKAFDDPDQAYQGCSVPVEGAGLRTVTIKCPSGNVASGAVANYRDAYLVLESYPASDNSWRFVLQDQVSSPVSVATRVVCL